MRTLMTLTLLILIASCGKDEEHYRETFYVTGSDSTETYIVSKERIETPKRTYTFEKGGFIENYQTITDAKTIGKHIYLIANLKNDSTLWTCSIIATKGKQAWHVKDQYPVRRPNVVPPVFYNDAGVLIVLYERGGTHNNLIIYYPISTYHHTIGTDVRLYQLRGNNIIYETTDGKNHVWPPKTKRPKTPTRPSIVVKRVYVDNSASTKQKTTTKN